MIKTIEWKDNRVVMIDQRKLPWEEICCGLLRISPGD